MSIMSKLGTGMKQFAKMATSEQTGEMLGTAVGKTINAGIGGGMKAVDVVGKRVASPLLGVASKAVKLDNGAMKLTTLGKGMVGGAVAYRGMSDAINNEDARRVGQMTGTQNMTPSFGPNYANTQDLVSNLHKNRKAF